MYLFTDECVDTPDIPAYLIDDRFDEISFPWLENMEVKHFDKEIPYISEDDNEGDGDDEDEDEDEKETKPKAYDPFDEDDEDENEKETNPKAYDSFDEDDEDEDDKETKPKAYDTFDEDYEDEDEKETKPKAYDPSDDEDSNTDEPTGINCEKEKSSLPDTKESNSVSEKPQKESIAYASTSQEAGTSYVAKKEKAFFKSRNKKGKKVSPPPVKGGMQVYNALPGLVQSNPCYQTTLIYDGYLMQSDLICLEYYEKYAYNDEYFMWTVNHYKYKSIMRQYHFFPGVLVPDMYCNYTPNYNVAPGNVHRNMHYTFTH